MVVAPSKKSKIRRIEQCSIWKMTWSEEVERRRLLLLYEINELTSPLMVPEPRTSPGLMLHPVTVC